jgi:carbonic anhydrase
MTSACEQLLQQNGEWAAQKLAMDPDYFTRLAQGQSPPFLVLGCSDSRVSPTQITMSEPGELFVHRNIANQFQPADPSAHAVLQYAVAVLKVKHIVVLGHYGCGGVAAALHQHSYGVVDGWIQPIRDIYRLYRPLLDGLPSDEERFRRLVELNVREQVFNLYKTELIQRTRLQESRPQLHGWVCDIATGKIADLGITEHDWLEIAAPYQFAFPGPGSGHGGGH